VLALIVIPFGVTTSPSAADFVCRRFHQCIKVNHQSPPSPRYARVPQAQHRMSTSSEVESGVQVFRCCERQPAHSGRQTRSETLEASRWQR
jgi:hypothetical protein